MENKYRILTLNLGSTSTKVSLFENEEKVFDGHASHDPKVLEKYSNVMEQFDYRVETIRAELEKNHVDLENLSAVVGRCGGTGGIASGTYEVNELLLHSLREGKAHKPHTADLGGLIADAFAKEYGTKAYIVNSPETDELIDEARITGLKGLYRFSSVHALNQKEMGIRYGKKIGVPYEKLNLVIAHIGGGVSITAHCQGKMIDSNNIISGDGPMAPTRSGALPAVDLIKMCFSGKYTEQELMGRVNMTGGLIDHLGTNDVLEIQKMIKNGDRYAKLIYDTMIYQIGKYIGSMASALNGKVDAIILTGGISRDKYLVDKITEMNSYIAPVNVQAGEFEMEALAAGAYRVLTGEEVAKEYTGIPVWNGFEEILSTHME